MTKSELGRGAAFLLGVRALLPMHLGVVPFGINSFSRSWSALARPDC